MTPLPPLVPLHVRAIILDVDGTLVLSNDAHAHAWSAAFREFGYPISFEQVRPLIGMGGDQLIPRLIPDLQADSKEGKDIAARRKAIFFNQYAPHLQAAPGAYALICRLQELGMRLIVGSSAASDELEMLLTKVQVGDVLTERTTADDAQSSKPAPDIVQVALQRLELPAHQVAMLGDSPYDILSAKQSAVALIAVRCGGFTDAELTGAYALYADPGDLLLHLGDVLGASSSSFPTTEAARHNAPHIHGDEETIV